MHTLSISAVDDIFQRMPVCAGPVFGDDHVLRSFHQWHGI
jgi:hypothetical protein